MPRPFLQQNHEHLSADDKKELANVSSDELSGSIKKELNGLGSGNREIISKYIILAEQNIDFDNKKALYWVEKAAKRAGRIPYIRKLYGILLYQNSFYKKAINELNTVLRLQTSSDAQSELIYLIADSYRGIKNPEKSIEIIKSIDTQEFNKFPIDYKIELLIVYAGARVDMNDKDIAKVILNNARNIAGNNKDLLMRVEEAAEFLL
jgi:tetratricopeptide (TPR) repeat protein